MGGYDTALVQQAFDERGGRGKRAWRINAKWLTLDEGHCGSEDPDHDFVWPWRWIRNLVENDDIRATGLLVSRGIQFLSPWSKAKSIPWAFELLRTVGSCETLAAVVRGLGGRVVNGYILTDEEHLPVAGCMVADSSSGLSCAWSDQR